MAKKHPILEEKDAEIKQRLDVLQTRYKNLLKKRIQAVRGNHEIPPDAELSKMDSHELTEVVDACGISFPPLIAAHISILGIDLPVISASKWKKINAIQALQSLENDLAKLEKET